MISTIRQLLIKHWGYSNFRPMQEEIILSVMEGKDTLALLPTGGGKSICFQIPGIALGGVTLVITPLIALMKDQVANLKSRNISAKALFSGMGSKEEEIVVNDAINGRIHFLYLSPERLQSSKFRRILHEIPVKLIAIDEAHCISQWGYDFRPNYLKINSLRDFFPNTPFLALTATATPEVVIDIQKKLEFKKPNCFSKSFVRSNLTYFVFKEEDKYKRLLKLLKRDTGCGIIYVRNRRKTAEVAAFLYKNGISADFYHAGLEVNLRDKKQQLWSSGKLRIMVATNAFGMGIDKPDVRTVIHLDLPDSLEAYYQEAGRGGRDEKPAQAILLWEQADISDAQRLFENSFPEPEAIKRIYRALGNYYNLAIGSGFEARFDFTLVEFAKRYNLKPLLVHNCMKILELEGVIAQTQAFGGSSKLMFKMRHNDLYLFQLEQKKWDGFIRLLLRLYGGLFSDFVAITERQIAFHAKVSEKQVRDALLKLHAMDIVDYIPITGKPQLIFTTERLSDKNIPITVKNYHTRKEVARKRFEAITHYTTSNTRCRSELLTEYFGEKRSQRCGNCDVCLERNTTKLSRLEFDQVVDELKQLISQNSKPLNAIIEALKPTSEQQIQTTLQWLYDHEKIGRDEDNNYFWK